MSRMSRNLIDEVNADMLLSLVQGVQASLGYFLAAQDHEKELSKGFIKNMSSDNIMRSKMAIDDSIGMLNTIKLIITE